MKKTVVSAVLLAGLASTSYAGKMVAPGVELVSEEQWTTPGATGHAEDAHLFFSSATVSAMVGSAFGHVFQNIPMTSSHTFSIQNTDDITKSYGVSIKLCADSFCTFNSRVYNVVPHGNYTSSAVLFLSASFTRPGTYSIIASTVMGGDAGTSYSTRASLTVVR